MASFKFLHAADLHLDSPLTGLAEKSEGLSRRIDDASRSAFTRLVQLAIAEECAFVIIAGDLFDGQWRDYRTGVYFASQMSLLRDAGIPVYIILGNHDAENRLTARLPAVDNVKLFSARAPETVRIESLQTAIHGQSFPARDVSANLAAAYPSPVPGWLNIGILHTALEGREGHALYAPCEVDQLKNHGYDYWALGHVHEYGLQIGSSKSEAPYVVYSGVLQGRNIREIGPKGVVLVSVQDGAVTDVASVPLDSVRWAITRVDISDAADLESVTVAAREALEREFDAVGERSLAVRVVLTGPTALHRKLAASRAEVRELVETAAAGISSEIWIEKVELRTTDLFQQTTSETVDPTIIGKLRVEVELRARDTQFRERIANYFAEIKTKIPAGACDEVAAEQIINEAAEAAKELARALLEKGLE